MEIHSYPLQRHWWRNELITAPIWLGLAFFSRDWWYLLLPLASVASARLATRWIRNDEANLMLSPGGLKVFGVDMPWSNVVRIESVHRAGRTRDVLVLDRGIVWSHGGRTVREIDLTRFDPNWRTGPIGEDIRRWAARLLLEDRAGTRA